MTNSQTVASNAAFVVKVYYDEDELNTPNGKPGEVGHTDDIAALTKLMQRAYEDYPNGYIDICYQYTNSYGEVTNLAIWRYAPTTDKEWYNNLQCYICDTKWDYE